MKKASYISFVVGCGVGTILAIGWHYVNVGRFPLSGSGMMIFGRITLWLCPSSMMLMEVDPLAPLRLDVAILYFTVILLNGLLYVLIVVIVRKLGSMAQGSAESK